LPGIVGIVPKPDKVLLDKMVSSIMHESWYRIDKCSSSFFSIGRVHLGTFNPEPQPIFNENRTLSIFFDGEIYDYNHEMEYLKTRGHKFYVNNDAEFCLHLYEEQGNDFVKELNGTFFLVMCDYLNRKVIIANDRYSIRRHYYMLNNRQLLFAPEAKAILQGGSFKKELNSSAVADFFAFGYLLGDKTLFKYINSFPPASISVYDGNQLVTERYWDFSYSPDRSLSEKQFVDKLVRYFRIAVNIRIHKNRRYGISLSGGLDSRVVLASVDKNRGKIAAYTFGNRNCDEVRISGQVSDKFNVKSCFYEITPEIIVANAEKEVYLTEGLDHIGLSYIYSIHKILSKDIDVVFDGLGLGLSLGGADLSKGIWRLKNDAELFDFAFQKERLFSGLFSDKEMADLFLSSYYDAIRDIPKNAFKQSFDGIKDASLANKYDHYLLLTRVKNRSMVGHVKIRTEVEYSSPTYDNQIISLITTIPPELRMQHRIYQKFLRVLSPELAKIPYNRTMIRADAPLIFWRLGNMYQEGKERIKQIIRRLSGGTILFLNKRSYVDFDGWLRTNDNFRKYLKELLLSNHSISKQYLNQHYITRIFQEHNSGKRNDAIKLLHLATFELFLRLFFSDD